MAPQPRTPRWYLIPVRVLLVTFICTLLSFAVSLLVGIIAIVAISAYRRVNPDMRLAYRHIALPAAFVVGCIAFVISTLMEVRYYRQSKTLAAIARVTEEHHLRIPS